MKRTARIERTTSETDIQMDFTIDGSGIYDIRTPVGFLTHMLELFTKHGLFDMKLHASGDVAVDYHHTVEDIGICLGQAIKQALGEKKGIVRYGDATVPMDEAAAQVHLDISGRPYLLFNTPQLRGKVGEFDLELVEEFFQAFVANSSLTLHITVLSGKNFHHIIESIFKACARALDKATQLDSRTTGVPSTKGTL